MRGTPALPDPEHLHCTFDLSTLEPDVEVLTCTGELDIADAPALVRALEGVTAPRLVVDLSGLEFIDSSGLSRLLHATHSHPDGRLATIVSAGPVARILDISGMNGVFNVVRSREAALAALGVGDPQRGDAA